jgi:putative ABC transport system substrate-binding protein
MVRAALSCVPAIRGLKERVAAGENQLEEARPTLRQRDDRVRRRELILCLGSAMTITRGLNAQQKAMPVIGFLGSTSPGPNALNVAAFHQGLSETGYVDGQNVVIEYRWAEGHSDRLPALAADLVGRNVEVIAAFGGPQPASAALRATAVIPIVAPAAGNFVKHFNRPEGNLTGVKLFTSALMPKRLQLLVELVPGAAIAVLANPAYSEYEFDRKQVENAAQVLGAEVRFVLAGTDADLEPAFANIAKSTVGALLISADPFFNSQRDQLVVLAARYAVPTMHEWRESVAAGGLISYGPSLTGIYRQLGIYVGKILKGAKPADLPIEQPTKFELVINLKTAKALGLTIPQSMLVRADEVIE